MLCEQGGKDLSDLVAAQDDLMAEINQRFVRSVQVHKLVCHPYV